MRRLVAILGGLLALTLSGQAGTVSGRVDLAQVPKPPPPAPRYADQAAEQPDPPPPPRAVVYAEGTFAPELLRPPAEPVVLRQSGLQFVPALLPILTGSRVRFPNEDEIYHNVFSYSPAKSFDLGRYTREEEAPVVTFETPGVVKLFCEVHSHMRGAILVLETPFFTVTDPDGRFRLEGLPPGSYRLRAWLSERKILTREITLTEGQDLTVDFTAP